jgi:hypothetical protein
MKKLLIVCLFLFVFFIQFSVKAQRAKKQSCGKTANFSEYTGRYRLSDSSLVSVKAENGKLILRPLFWRTPQPLRAKSADEFVHEERANRRASFQRDPRGCVEAVILAGFGRDDGTFRRLDAKPTALELLLGGKPQPAAEMMVKNNPNEASQFVEIARQLLRNFPSKKEYAVKFLEILAKHYPNAPSVFSALGDAQIAAGNRSAAKEGFRQAFQLDKTDEAALRGLRRLNVLPPEMPVKAGGWKVPFSLDDVFRKPTAAEIAEVEADWARRDLSPKEVAEVETGRINLGNSTATVRIIAHRVHGFKHYGAIIVPDGINGKAPVILDLKGVSWDFFPLNLADIKSPKILGADQNKFIYVVPSFRGEILKYNNQDFVSEGDRTDSWDGATDDALALLNAALTITPQADAERIAAFGKSRGGSLALLAGIRSRKIKRVLDWAGPVDWFALMAGAGWTQKEITADALLYKAAPNEDGGQFIERFMLKAVAGKWNLQQVRFKLIADSPIYFVENLPPTQAHYGVEDEMVPLVNGQALVQKMKMQGRAALDFTSFFHQDSGHDLDQEIAFTESKKFLLALLTRGR